MAKEDINEMNTTAQSDSASHSERNNQVESQTEQSTKGKAQKRLDERISTKSRNQASSLVSPETDRAISPPPATLASVVGAAGVVSSSDDVDNKRPWTRRQQTLENNGYAQRQTPYSDSAMSTYTNQRMSEEPFHGLKHSFRSSSNEYDEEEGSH